MKDFCYKNDTLEFSVPKPSAEAIFLHNEHKKYCRSVSEIETLSLALIVLTLRVTAGL